LKDALEPLGVQVEAIAISPYKGALDNLTRNSISPEGKEQLEWLLDSRYDMIVNDIAESRNLTPAKVKKLIDSAPYMDDAALKNGLVDGIVNEEQFPQRLSAKHILHWKQADKVILYTWRDPEDRHVALLKIGGMIIHGESANPPVDFPTPIVGGERAGDLTVVQQVRKLAEDKKTAAVVLFIDSPGGSASASEAIASALEELAKVKPVVAYMNAVAASGGYYVATPAQWIVAQPGTITGSIGVIIGKPSTEGAFKKLRINRVSFARGANTGMLSDAKPFTAKQKTWLKHSIEQAYGLFVERVAKGRNMTPEAVDAIGGGRVWTGKQALENGLVDELGDLRAALEKARSLAKLPESAPLVIPQIKGDPIGPKLVEQVNPVASLRYLHDNVRLILNGQAQMFMPFSIE
jgi:protease-4